MPPYTTLSSGKRPLGLPDPHRTQTDAPSPGADRPLNRRWERTRPWRLLLLTLLSMLSGGFLLRILLPLMPTDTLAELCRAHTEPLRQGGLAPLLVWLRLLARQLPVLLLLAAAGLTRFSGALTSGVLLWRGVSDGAVVCLLLALWRGTARLSDAALLPSCGLWLAAFAVKALFDAALRIVMAGEARRLAVTLSPLPGVEHAAAPPSPATVRALLWHYLSIIPAVFGGYMLIEGVYVALLCTAF